MSKHPTTRRSVATLSPTRGSHEATLPTFLNGQDARFDQPGEYLTITECRRLEAAGSGTFINRGKGFRRHDRNFIAHEFRRAQREQDSAVRHWQAKNGALQLVKGDVPGRAGHFSYPTPPAAVIARSSCRCGNCESLSQGHA